MKSCTHAGMQTCIHAGMLTCIHACMHTAMSTPLVAPACLLEAIAAALVVHLDSHSSGWDIDGSGNAWQLSCDTSSEKLVLNFENVNVRLDLMFNFPRYFLCAFNLIGYSLSTYSPFESKLLSSWSACEVTF